MSVFHVSHETVPAGESQLAPLVLTVVLLVVNLAVKQDVLNPGVGEAADAADDFAGGPAAAEQSQVVPRL